MAEFDWTFPYPSQRMPVLARNVVATSQPLAAQAGLQMLREGGNAADAAVATAMAMTVLEPTTNGIGSDAFALAWFDGKLHGLNGSGRSPKSLAASRFAGLKDMPRQGWNPVMVPGAVSAWMELSHRFGKLPFGKLCDPAIEYASKGFPVAPLTAALWARAANKYKDFPEWGRTFLKDGKPPEAGEIFKMPDHARTLEQIAASGGEAFYRGDLAQQIAAQAKNDGAAMTLEDLASHRADWVEPIAMDYHGHRLHEIPPNGQGIVALMALGILRSFDFSSLQPDCPDVIHLQIEAMKLAFADAHAHVADPVHMKVSVEGLLDPAYLQTRAKLIKADQAQDFNHGQPKKGGTILLCAADASGGMVSFIQSQYEGFGCGVVISGTGIAMNNRGACFTLEEGHPNQVAGGKRPYHTIIPGFVTRASLSSRERGGVRADSPESLNPIMAFGVMGGFMQPQGHVQVFLRIFQFKQNPQAALDAPRWQVTTGLKVMIEPGFEPSLYEELRKRGHEIEIVKDKNVAFGRGQCIYKLEDSAYCAASDLRADGQAAGY
jgi:gamma-glutamyltranspeptidase/glutathione hydrolase